MMRPLLAPLLLTLAVQALLSFASATVPVLILVAAVGLGVPLGIIGLVTAITYLCAGLASLVAGGLVAGHGAVRACQVCLVLGGCGMALTATGTLAGLLVGAALLGLGYGPATPAASHLLTRVTPRRVLASVFSINRTSIPIGIALAGAVLPLLAQRVGWQGATLLVGLALAAGALPLFAFRHLDEAPAALPLKLSPLSPLARLGATVAILFAEPRLRALTLCAIVYLAAQSSMATFLVAHLVGAVGLSLAKAGAWLAVAQMAGMVGRVVLAGIADALDGRTAMLIALGLIIAAGAALTGGIDQATGDGAALAILVLFGASVMGWNGILLAECARAAPPGRATEVVGAATAVGFGGAVLGPIGFSLMVPWLGYGGAFTAIGSIALAAALLLSLAPAAAKA